MSTLNLLHLWRVLGVTKDGSVLKWCIDCGTVIDDGGLEDVPANTKRNPTFCSEGIASLTKDNSP